MVRCLIYEMIKLVHIYIINLNLANLFWGAMQFRIRINIIRRKQWLTQQIPKAVNEIYSAGSTIGAYIIFPNNQIDKKQTINGARGCNGKIDDRFDLTLECIRRFYLGLQSPLHDVFLRYRDFFGLFGDFRGYIDFFLLQDLVTENYAQIKFYLPFDDFMSAQIFYVRLLALSRKSD